ncbi:MAG: ABC transporter permease [Pseudomonadales bacterium]|jgi:peptide/nickel transport system permease protein|nr:ABC transporter permease [Pseudomonadales bacterium]MBP9033619.1 ABC transporter permease [Pseudomonadales bacterium]
MIAYLLRRLLLAVPTLIGVNLLLFTLFFVISSPDDMARAQLGAKRVTPEAIERWKADRGYDKPLFWNARASGSGRFTETIFVQKSARMFLFDFGKSDVGRDINRELRTRMWPSLALAVPVFLVGLFVAITLALLLAFLRATWLDFTGVVICVVLMSISSLFYVIAGQYVIARVWNLVPISGFADGLDAGRFLALPVAVGVIAGLGANVRWYRAIFLEEIGKDYVRTARAKGLSEIAVLFRHVLKNGMIPILTGTVVVIPSLFLGSLITESFFGIPGLGTFTIEAILMQDFAIVRSMVFIGSVLYIAGLVLTDLSYTLVDPRVRLQ